MFLTK